MENQHKNRIHIQNKIYWCDSLVGGVLEELGDLLAYMEKSGLYDSRIYDVVNDYHVNLRDAWTDMPDNEEIDNLLNEAGAQ